MTRIWIYDPTVKTPRQRIDEIVGAIAGAHEVSPADIMGPTQVRRVVRARWAVWRIMRDEYQMTLPQIGRAFGKDHTTVLHGLRRVGG